MQYCLLNTAIECNEMKRAQRRLNRRAFNTAQKRKRAVFYLKQNPTCYTL